MLFGKFDSYTYSRPVSYRSYNPRLTKAQILPINDTQSQQILKFLRSQNLDVQDFGGLARGFRFEDLQVGKRHYNHNNYHVNDEYYIHQWKKTDDLKSYHPTGTHLVFKSYPQFFNKLRQVVEERRKKY